jgi:ribonuclease T2
MVIAAIFSYLRSKDAVAVMECEAFNDLAATRNSAQMRLEKGRHYDILRSYGEKYMISVGDGGRRWVERSCLKPSKREEGERAKLESSEVSLESLLAVSWHNAFCSTHSGRKECRPLYNRAKDRLVLHGLWPQPKKRQYCGMSGDIVERDRKHLWGSLPPRSLSPDLKRKMLVYMPGYLSNLHRHEWVKHGSCYDRNPERYFSDALSLVEELDRSMVGEYLRSNIGGKVTLRNIRKVFERSFGKGMGNRLSMLCKKGFLQELRINIRGRGSRLEKLLQKASPMKRSCTEARVR